MTKTKSTKITWSHAKRKVSELKPSDYNPRKMTPQEKKDIERSIDGFGRVVPLVINAGSRANILIGGHQRWKIYSEKKIEEIDVMVPSRELTFEEEQELNLRLNKNLGSWDYDLLQDMDLELLLDVGFSDDDLQGFFDDVELADDEYDVANNRNVAELAFRYLQQWDYGSESEHSPLDKEPWGSSDKTHDFQDGDWTYTLSINPSLDYISLTRWKAAQ